MQNNEVKVPTYLSVGKIITYAMYIWVIFGIIVLGIRVFLLAFSANGTTPFVNFIYNTSDSFLQPFRGIFPPKSVGSTGYLDVAALFAMIIYGLVGWGFSALINYIQGKIDAYTAQVREQRRLQAMAAAGGTAKKPAATASASAAGRRTQVM